jgi:YD repeat-containing protein
MTMSRRRLSFTERRRTRLSFKPVHDRLEIKNTITEPISVLGLSLSAFRGLAQIGIVVPDAGAAASGLVRAEQAAGQARRSATQAPALPTNFVPTVIGPQVKHAKNAGGGAPKRDAIAPAPSAKVESGSDWLADLFAWVSDPAPTGIAAPWHPAVHAGAGAALPPRGGSGSAPPPGHTAPLQVPLAPESAPAIPFLPSTTGSRSKPPGNGTTPVITRNAAALSQSQAGGGGAARGVPLFGAGGGTLPTIINENPSSMPASTDGNGSGFSAMSFPYFPLYVLDENNGIVLFNGQYQQATLNTTVDLYAQVKGTTVSTYSWTTSGNFTGTGLAGTGTYHVHFQWPGTQASAQVESITLTVTDANSHQESETIDFQVPTSNIVTMPSSASWPVTIPADLVQPGAPAFDSQGVSVDAVSGALDASIDLPSYNPNVPALSLVYNSLTADPRPIVLVHHTLDDTKSVPTKVDATLTFNGSAGTKWVYDTSAFIAGDVQQIALQANATALSTGRYSYSVQLIDERSFNTTLTYNGTATVLNESTSAVGDGWTVQGLEQVIPAGDSSGVILLLGDNGESLWFAGNPGVGSSYTTPAGEFSTLTKTSSGYTRTLPDGTQITFNSSGYQTATIDLNSLHVTFGYNGSNQLTSILDPYGNYVTLTYSSGKLSTIQDPAGRVATVTFSGNNLQAVTQADGSLVTYSYDGSGRMTQMKDQRANTVTIAYDSIERASTITRPDGTTQLFSAYQEQGWTNTGTSGSPAVATLLAEAVTNYTTPAGNTLQTRPDWMGLGRLGQATDAFGNVFSNDLNSNGLPIVSVDGQNRITQATYDSLGNPVTIAYPDLTTDHYTYNSDSEPLTHTDGNGHTTSLTYDGNGNLTGIKDALLNLTTLTYTANGQVQTIKDANAKVTSIQYDSQDRVTTIQFPDGTTNLYSYNSQGNITTVTDGRSNATTYSYDALNRLTGSTDALNNLTTLTLDAAGNVTKVQAPTPAGQTARTTTFAYDSMNRVTTVVDPLGNQSVIGYDADGNEASFKDPLGRITTTQYDAMDNPAVVIDPMGNHVTATFDADGEQLTSTDALNRTTTYSYSVRGWLAMITDPMGFLTTITYTPTGKQSGTYQTAGSLLETSALTYDAADRLQSKADGLSNLTTFSYDGVGNVTAIKDPNNNITSYAYDSRNRVTTVTDALGHSTVIGYDNSGNQQTVTDALGHTATALYDALNRATTLISAISRTTTIAFDAAGRQTSLTDPVGNRTQWSYDSNDRLTTLTQPNNATVTYVYDAAGELTDTTDADSRRTTLAYDADGAQTGETWVGASPSEKITYTFDAAHQLTKVADSFATLTFVYDNDSRLTTQVTSGPGTGQPTVTLTYSYDQLGEETSVTDSLSSQGITTYSYSSFAATKVLLSQAVSGAA